MNDTVQATHEIISDFQAMLLAGSGLSLGDDPRGKTFDENLRSGSFVKSGLQDVAANLMTNIRRLLAHARMPMDVFNYGRQYEAVFNKEAAKAVPQPSDAISASESIFWQAQNATWQWILGLKEHSVDKYVGGNFSHVAGFAAAMKRDPRFDETHRSHIVAFGGALIIEAWTLFESFSEDLWEGAVNSHPTILGDLSNKCKVSFDDLQSNAFNVRRKLGSLLKKRDPIGFRSIHDIQTSYKLAFSVQGKAIEDILNDKELQFAASVRNILIHKSGIMDKEYDDQVAGIADAPRFDPIHPEQQFPLTGKICARLTDTCRSRAIWLVNAVHSWIIGHPETLPTSGESDAASA